MSYLSAASIDLPNSTKATISLWFRIPQASMDAAAAAFEDVLKSDPDNPYDYGYGWKAGTSGGIIAYDAKPPQMAGIIPLVTFGKAGSQSNVAGGRIENFGSYEVTTFIWQYTSFPEGEWVIGRQDNLPIEDMVPAPSTETWDTEPSYIGVWCTEDPPRALLAVNLEMTTYADTTGIAQPLANLKIQDRQFYEGPKPFPPHTWGQEFEYHDVNPNPAVARTENFRTHPLVGDVSRYDGTSETSPSFGITVTPDQWHHLLLSFDLTSPCITHGVVVGSIEEQEELNNAENPSKFVDRAPMLWIAYDDENKEGRDLSYYWRGKGATGSIYDPPDPDKPDDDGADPNEILSPAGWRIAGMACGEDNTTTRYDPDSNETSTITSSGITKAEYDSGTGELPMQGEPMGLPASEDWVDSIYHVEMAELQMWFGQSLDTAKTANRRPFIDDQGKPVAPDKKLTEKNSQQGSIDFMGRSPDVMLHKSSNWISGKNTGTTGLDPDNKPIADGQFIPIAKITAYKPDPSLHGARTRSGK